MRLNRKIINQNIVGIIRLFQVYDSIFIIISIFKSNQMTDQLQNPEELSAEQLNQEMIIMIDRNVKYFQNQKKVEQYLKDQIIHYSKQIPKIQMEINDLLARNQRTVQQVQEIRKKIQQTDIEKEQLSRKIDQKKKCNKKITQWSIQKINDRLMELSAFNKQIMLLETNNEYVIQNINSFESKLYSHNKQFQKLQAQYRRTEEEFNQFHELIDQCYLTKKKMNSELQEQRGNIRVYCRIRPFHSNEDEWPICELLNENTLKLNVPKEHQKTENGLKEHIFNFEQIFCMRQSQQDVFQELSQLIQNAVDGKNVCIFAYGQTGSGKTFTMQGGSTEKSKGIIPRSIKLIFSQVKRAQKYKWNFEISVSIQEVYLDGVRDLIEPKKEDNDIVSKFIVKKPEELECYIQQASKNRKVAETSCNEHSSRSHLIVTINIHSRNDEKNLERQGSINLVDLAGSERVSLSRVQGDRLKQTQSINKSLTNLKIVISALAKKQQHVPFRNSKLTFLLQKYLEGESKTLMFVNISPKMSDYYQTLCSLKFADQVKECKIKKSM